MGFIGALIALVAAALLLALVFARLGVGGARRKAKDGSPSTNLGSTTERGDYPPADEAGNEGGFDQPGMPHPADPRADRGP